tara:strand:- start:326 stop:526 length:201 start_codon:yes stop_codon:yes gene_type:complete
MNKDIRHIIDQMVKEKEYKKNNGPIEVTADQLWKYSGEVEPTNPNIIKYENEIKNIKRFKNGRNNI